MKSLSLLGWIFSKDWDFIHYLGVIQSGITLRIEYLTVAGTSCDLYIVTCLPTLAPVQSAIAQSISQPVHWVNCSNKSREPKTLNWDHRLKEVTLYIADT